ncbi:NCA2-domain-containing protein [Punctularia strigosozonata HHB-11173 SS5]|uniref:NCA2-domain-containing protein n=1 Tax=Punctularia strigosozonata (strain HHB-11173) TaxID=741275 RepID=UPI000441833A|nr:NCA2-domain-containing protein [Punctularia strigosozonata HHB-11173 SS5]EIN12720.1 NCA2-domain-containing protein [Punctularia strigosozonata HHB-11173 SS5]
MSTFVAHQTHALIAAAVPASPTRPGTPADANEELGALFLSLTPPISLSQAQSAIDALKERGSTQLNAAGAAHNEEARALQHAVLGRISVALYAHALQLHLDEASQADEEADWWFEVERSQLNAAQFLLQTLPIRLRDAAKVIVQALRRQNIPISPSAFTPSSLRRLFPSTSSLRPNALLTALFPTIRSNVALQSASLLSASGVASTLLFPLELVRQECRLKRKKLQRIRDERAEVLGRLADMRGELEKAVSSPLGDNADADASLLALARTLEELSDGRSETDAAVDASGEQDVLSTLSTLAFNTLPEHGTIHATSLRLSDLRRPSRLTLAWPRLLLLPPLSLYAIKLAYTNRSSLAGMVRDARETVIGFWRGWILEPLREMVRTVRAGGEGGVIVSAQGVEADVKSLERMTLALAKEKLHYGAAQLDALSSQIRVGDLTPVLEIYEEDIKSPLKSAVAGTLLRSVFIQVQKAKVDIDQALAGIDKLLKSQELTFAFVGVAPALAIVYVLGGSLRQLWLGGKGRGRYGGRKRRVGAWVAMRRIERLLIAQPTADRRHAPRSSANGNGAIPPLTSGLLLLSVTHLRQYAETALPANSRIREGFLEDVGDLEDPSLGRAEKLRVIDRMWRSWGAPLGWDHAAGGGYQ